MTSATAADHSVPLTSDRLLHERVARLFPSATTRRLWMMFLGEDDVASELLLPFAGLPSRPDEVVDTPDLGRVAHATVLGDRVAALMRQFDFAQVVFVWERPGAAGRGGAQRVWARALTQACRDQGARVRAHFALDDGGVRALEPEDPAAQARGTSPRHE